MKKRTTQLSIFLSNRPGVLADVTETLARAKVNILAMSVADTVDACIVRMVVDQPRRAADILGGGGLLVLENEVLSLDLPHRPGTLRDLSRRLSKAGVNIEYLYVTAPSGGKKATMILRPNDLARAERALAGAGTRAGAASQARR